MWARAAMGGALVALLATPVDAGSGSFRKGPYLQNVSRTSVTIVWESRDREPGVVRLLDGSDRSFKADNEEMHEVIVSGLESGRRYRYEVLSGDSTVRGEFATAPEANEPFSFVVFGDSRSYAGNHRNVVERVRREVPDFILGTGDMVDKGGREVEWQRFFDIERELLRENVLFPSLGNHDRQGPGRTADNFRKYFSLPENSPNPERYYAFTYGNSRFLVLDSNAYSFALTDQTAWIEQQLQESRLDPKIKHIFVAMHHPPFSISLHGGRTELRDAWTPLFEKYGVTAVFSGHDHCYSRAERNGVYYFVSGGGGAPLYPRARKPSKIDLAATKYFERVNHYLRVVIVGDLVEVTAVRVDGSIMESVSWGTPPKPVRVLARAADSSIAAGAESAPTIQIANDEVKAAAVVGTDEEGFGFLGFAGLGVMLAAGAFLFYSLRR